MSCRKLIYSCIQTITFLGLGKFKTDISAKKMPQICPIAVIPSSYRELTHSELLRELTWNVHRYYFKHYGLNTLLYIRDILVKLYKTYIFFFFNRKYLWRKFIIVALYQHVEERQYIAYYVMTSKLCTDMCLFLRVVWASL